MVLRRPHRKSRNGCLTCKQRRVKCDEKGPPCGPCATRAVDCKYAQAEPPKPRRPEHFVEDGEPANASVATNWSQSLRLLELQLMQQWTSITYKSYCGTVEEEYHNWQILVPKLALKHDFLLDGLFAMSALEIGAFSEEQSLQEYVDIALEYQNRASRKLREELSTVDLTTIAQDKHQALWALSSTLMVLALAMPPYAVQSGYKYSMLDHMMTYLELLKGFTAIVLAKITSLKDDPLLCKYRNWDELDILPIEPESQAAIDRLKELNEETYGAARVKSDVSELQALTYHAACRRAIFFLEETLAKCSESHTRAYGLGWLALAGNDFIAALKAKEPLALLILTHWGVFLEKQGYGVWYVEGVGKHLVEDLSDEIMPHKNERMQEGLNWVRKQVGLEVVDEAMSL